jgi:two-component system response regulator TtrR
LNEPDSTSGEAAVVYVVDDDDAFRDSLRWLLESAGLRVQTHADAREFLQHFSPGHPGCLVLDIRMPEMHGLELQERLNQLSDAPPIIFVTGHGDVPMAVSAVKKGAVDFIEKPFNDEEFLGLVRNALQVDAARRASNAQRSSALERLKSLTQRERAVMDLVVAGRLNKMIADELRISIKTVEAHRARVMGKLGVNSVAGLVQVALNAKAARAPH